MVVTCISDWNNQIANRAGSLTTEKSKNTTRRLRKVYTVFGRKMPLFCVCALPWQNLSNSAERFF